MRRQTAVKAAVLSIGMEVGEKQVCPLLKEEQGTLVKGEALKKQRECQGRELEVLLPRPSPWGSSQRERGIRDNRQTATRGRMVSLLIFFLT